MYVVGGGDTPTIYFNAQSTRTVLSGRRRSGATGWGGGRGTIILVLCWKLIYGKRTENRRKDWHGGQETKRARKVNTEDVTAHIHTNQSIQLTHQRTRKTRKTKPVDIKQ